jgi:anti-sigma B factor antagonist
MSLLCSWAADLFRFGSASPHQSLHQPQVRPVPASEVNSPGPRSKAVTDPFAASVPSPRLKTTLVVSSTDRDRAVVVSLAGEASTDNLQPLEIAAAGLLARRVPLIVLDCSELTLLSSLAMSILVGLRRDLGRWHGCVKLACLAPSIHSALQVARLTTLFEVHATVEEALATADNALAPAGTC